MQLKDYAEIMNLPEEKRREAFEKEKQRIFERGTVASSVQEYLKQYFELETVRYFVAFQQLPIDSELKEYQVVKHGLTALKNLETDLSRKISDANRLMEPQLEEKEENRNLNL